MYLTAHRVRRIKGNNVEVGIDVFLHSHEAQDFPNTPLDDQVIDWITNKKPGKLIAESVDLVPGGNSVLSFIDIVGKENVDSTRIQNLLDQMEPKIIDRDTTIEFDSPADLAVRFGITLGLRGHEVREYKALTERAMSLFESREPPKWRSETPWIVIHYELSDTQEIFHLSPKTAKHLKQMHSERWVPKRIFIDHQIKNFVESVYGDLIQHIAPVLTDLTLEQIAAQGGLILCDQLRQKKIKWPELKEL